jgi:NTP pyrophosphatase (non-canonical NTP hydrolase)
VNTTEHLLTCIAEEAAEIAQAATKALRFGMKGHYPDGTRNDTKIIDELNDLLGVVRLLQTNGHLQLDVGDEDAINAKINKVIRYMALADTRGTLQ